MVHKHDEKYELRAEMRYDHSNMKLTIERRTNRTETTKGFSQKYIFAIFFLSMPELPDIIMIFRNPTDRKKKRIHFKNPISKHVPDKCSG